MHKALLLEDILRRIMLEYSQPLANSSSTTRRVDMTALAALARVCTAFTDCALDALWVTLRSIQPLVRLLTILRGDRAISSKTIADSEEEAVWTSFMRYARRVRHIALFDEDISDSFFWSILPHQPVLPLLTELHWTSHSLKGLRRLPRFIQPTLKSLNITYISESGSLESNGDPLPDGVIRQDMDVEYISQAALHPLSICAWAVAQCCHLRKLGLKWRGDLGPDVSPVAALSQLTKVTLHDDFVYCPHLLVRLSRLSSLRSLFLIDHRPMMDRPELTYEAVPTGFPALTLLSLKDLPTSCLLSLLESLPDCPLESLILHLVDFEVLPSNQIALADVLAQRFHGTFRKIFIGSANTSSPHGDVRVDTVRRLLQLDLAIVHLSMSRDEVIDDEFCREIAHAWPHLQSLHLMSWSCPEYATAASISGLSAIVESCPELLRLAITINAEGPMPPEVGNICRPSTSKLRYLDVQRSPLSLANCSAVAGYIRHQLSALKTLSWADSCPWQYRAKNEAKGVDNWRIVEQHVFASFSVT